MYHVISQGVDERMMNVHYYYHSTRATIHVAIGLFHKVMTFVVVCQLPCRPKTFVVTESQTNTVHVNT